jgi:hypothetical protein
MAELIGQAQRDPNLAETLRARWLQPRRDVTTAIMKCSIERGEIRADTDLATLIDQLYAPLYFRLTMQHQPLHADLADALVHNLLDGVRVRTRIAEQGA